MEGRKENKKQKQRNEMNWMHERVFFFFFGLAHVEPLRQIEATETNYTPSRAAQRIDQKHIDSVALICIAYSPAPPDILLYCGFKVSGRIKSEQQVITSPPSITILIDFQPAIYIREAALLPY